MQPTDRDNSAEYYKVYEEYSKTLRTWFVAYGIGAPAIFITNDAAAKLLKNPHDLKFIAMFFLTGVALQVTLASVNKFVMWTLYYGEINSEFKSSHSYKCCNWLSSKFWIDILVDVLAMGAFALATWKVIKLVTA